MRTSLSFLNFRSGRLFGLLAVAAATLAIAADDASAKHCRKGKSSCGSSCGTPMNYGSSSCGGCGSVGYNSYPGMSYGYGAPGCSTCPGMPAGGMMPAQPMPSPMPAPKTTMYMPPAGMVMPVAGTTTNGSSIVQASGTTPAGGETGMRVVEVESGPARTAGVQQGAVIVNVDGRRVRTFDDLRTALRGGQNTAKVTFVDANGQRMTRDVAVKDTMIGVSVVQAPVSIPAGDERSDRRNNAATAEPTAPTQPRDNDRDTTTPAKPPHQRLSIPSSLEEIHSAGGEA